MRVGITKAATKWIKIPKKIDIPPEKMQQIIKGFRFI